MDRDLLFDALLSTFDDQRVTRTERKAIAAIVDDADPSEHDREVIEARLFETIGARMRDQRDRELLHALRVVVGQLRRKRSRDGGADRRPTRVWFGPEEPMAETLCTLIRNTQETLDVAVFTITDDRVTRALIEAHRRGVRVRILSDDDKSGDRGSDIERLGSAGVPVHLDGSPHHFHHKFAVFDRRSVLTGSYNWTRGAARSNRENFMLTFEAEAVTGYAENFDRLWQELARRDV